MTDPNTTADTTDQEVNGDPSNTDIDVLTGPLAPDDDVFSLINAEEPTTLADDTTQS